MYVSVTLADEFVNLSVLPKASNKWNEEATPRRCEIKLPYNSGSKVAWTTVLPTPSFSVSTFSPSQIKFDVPVES
jgi:hypothetical protein